MKLESGVPVRSVDKSSALASRPASATLCYVLAVASVLGAVFWVFMTLLGIWSSGGFLFAGICAASAIFWWIVGDALSALAQRK